jgi:hypothetical protein
MVLRLRRFRQRHGRRVSPRIEGQLLPMKVLQFLTNRRQRLLIDLSAIRMETRPGFDWRPIEKPRWQIKPPSSGSLVQEVTKQPFNRRQPHLTAKRDEGTPVRNRRI